MSPLIQVGQFLKTVLADHMLYSASFLFRYFWLYASLHQQEGEEAVLFIGLLCHSTAYISTAIGFALALIIFAGIREQLAMTHVPEGMKGTPIALITAGLLAMAFMGFSGIV